MWQGGGLWQGGEHAGVCVLVRACVRVWVNGERERGMARQKREMRGGEEGSVPYL